MSDIVWHNHKLLREDREKLNAHLGGVLWFTGLSGSGKSTIAGAVEELLYARKLRTYLLDGDNVRHGLNKDLGFSEEDRVENIRRIGEVSALFVDAGIVVLTAFISPFQRERDMVRALLPEDRFLEVFIDTPLEICEQRDVKGLYAKARNGEIPNFTGIDSPYEPPVKPELHLETGKYSIAEAAERVVEEIEKRKWFL